MCWQLGGGLCAGRWEEIGRVCVRRQVGGGGGGVGL